MYRWLAAESLTQRPRYAEHTRETFNSVVDIAERIARERFAPVNRLVDTEEPTFDGKCVILPDATHMAVSTYAESGLLAAGQDFDVGGMQLPYVVEMAANAFFTMASVSLSSYAILSCANANLLMAHGTPRQRQAFALPLLHGRYMGTIA